MPPITSADQIELRKIKIVAAMSEETTCFIADLYIHGKKVGTVQNSGHGGCNSYNFNTRELQGFAESLPPLETRYGALPMDLDLLVESLLEKEEKRKEDAKFVKKGAALRLKGQVLLVGRDGNAVVAVNCAPEAVEAWKTKVAAKYGPQTFTVYQ